jgi:ketosteroid isomerase-like protein
MKGKLMIVAKLVTTCAGIAVFVAGALGAGTGAGQVRSLEETYAEANAALLRGDAERWNELIPLANDFLLFSPFGGKPSRSSEYTPERIHRMGRFFKNGTFDQEVVQVVSSGNLVVLATIERANVAVGEVPQQDWALRVTSVFRREGNQWRLVHRHADPFVKDVSVDEAARIARGERTAGAK